MKRARHVQNFVMAAGGESIAKYVGHKVAKTRWSPIIHGQLTPSNIFSTGGWDNKINKICVWKIEDSSQEILTKPNEASEPSLQCEVDHFGDVTELQYIDPERLVAASSSGSLTAYRYTFSQRTQKYVLQPIQSWMTLHHEGQRGCPCTCVAVSPTTPDLVSVGEDGRINVVRLEDTHPVQTIDDADSTSISGVSFTKTHEVATVNFIGQLKVWDFRQNENKPSRTMLLAGDRVSLLCVATHPTQPHLLAAGGQDGVLSIWDMRQETYPVTLLEAHKSELWEVKFHPRSPDNLFTCSEDGSIWHWDGTSMGVPAVQATPKPLHMPGNISIGNGAGSGGGYSTASPWLSVDATKHRLETFSLLPYNRLSVNSLDIESKHLVCGCDSEAFFILQDLVIR